MPDSIAAIAATISTSAAAYWPHFSLQTPIPNWVVISGNSSPWYVEVIRTAIGAFIGALLAFGSALLQRRMQERNANLRAGNLALFNLRAIYRQTGEVRLGVRSDIAKHRKAFADAPTWALLRPLMIEMDHIDGFDLESLSFLLDSELGKEAVQHVAYANELYSSLKAVVAQHQEIALEFQKQSIDLYRANPNALWDQLKDHAGPQLVGGRIAFFDALLLRIEKDPALLRACFERLDTAMKERFGNKVWALDLDFDPDSKRAKPNLPPLPDDIAKAVAEMPR